MEEKVSLTRAYLRRLPRHQESRLSWKAWVKAALTLVAISSGDYLLNRYLGVRLSDIFKQDSTPVVWSEVAPTAQALLAVATESHTEDVIRTVATNEVYEEPATPNESLEFPFMAGEVDMALPYLVRINDYPEITVTPLVNTTPDQIDPEIIKQFMDKTIPGWEKQCIVLGTDIFTPLVICHSGNWNGAILPFNVLREISYGLLTLTSLDGKSSKFSLLASHNVDGGLVDPSESPTTYGQGPYGAFARTPILSIPDEIRGKVKNNSGLFIIICDNLVQSEGIWQFNEARITSWQQIPDTDNLMAP